MSQSSPVQPPTPAVALIAPTIDESAVVRVPGPRQDAPLVVLLHGLGSHERDLVGLTPFLPTDFRYVSLRGIYAYGQGYAWMDWPLDPEDPTSVETSAAAVARWIAAQDAPVVGAIGFSQGACLALQLLRQDPQALDWIVQLSGFPFPAPLPGDAALAEASPRALWGHGGLDPHFGPEREDAIRAFMHAHFTLEEERRPSHGHAVDEVELRAIAAFLQRRADERADAAGTGS
ncbi:alpha/beta hydrolase [Brachybacterium sp. DNPG3]